MVEIANDEAAQGLERGFHKGSSVDLRGWVGWPTKGMVRGKVSRNPVGVVDDLVVGIYPLAASRVDLVCVGQEAVRGWVEVQSYPFGVLGVGRDGTL